MAALVFSTIVKVAITVASNIYLTAKNNDLSRDMFNKAMYSSKSKVSKNIQKKIKDKTKDKTNIKNAIKACIEKSDGKSFTSADCSDSFEYTSGDLYYSLQHVDYSISGEKTDDITWKLDVNLNDTYDFTEWRTGFTIGNMANNLGFVMQHTGLLRPYYWDVNYSMNYKEE